jgi:hypothetical protein
VQLIEDKIDAQRGKPISVDLQNASAVERRVSLVTYCNNVLTLLVAIYGGKNIWKELHWIRLFSKSRPSTWRGVTLSIGHQAFAALIFIN